MKYWQKIWLWFVLIGSLLHTLRDVLQTLEIRTFLSTVLVKENGTHEGIWNSANTVVLELVLIVAAISLLTRNTFGWVGYTTIGIALCTLLFFLVYWFLV